MKNTQQHAYPNWQVEPRWVIIAQTLEANNMIVIQFSKSNTITSKLIRLFTWSWASHVDFVMDHGDLLGATFKEGVCIRDGLKEARKFSKTERYTVELSLEDEQAVLRAVASQMDKKYDVMGVLGIFFRRKMQRRNRWFCSELVAWAFQESGNPLLKQKAGRITPRDLLMSTKLIHVKDIK